MGTVHSSTVVTVSGGFFISTNLIIFKEQWLTLGITASNSSSGTRTTLMATVPWTRTTLSVWPFATPSSRARETSIKPLSRRTRRSWLTCGTRSLSWLTSTRMEKFLQMNSLKINVACKGKAFADLPPAFKFFVDAQFRTLDVDGDGTVGLTEYRVDCVNRMAYKDIKDLDAAYEKLLNDDDKKAGGITLARYQELYAQFIGNPDESCNACYLFGPLEVIG